MEIFSWLIFALGVAATSIITGFIVGASSSPVAGVTITATFGILAVAFGLVATPMIFKSKSDSEKTKESQARSRLQLGLALCLFSSFFFWGIRLGQAERRQYKGPKSNPWVCSEWEDEGEVLPMQPTS